MKVVVTGANGFIGSAIVRKLLEKGYDVTALVREDSDCRNLRNLPVQFAFGDLTEEASLKHVFKHCRVVFHVGALYRLWNPDASQFYKTNVEGTRNVMLCALAAGVDRIVYTSSVATLGTATIDCVANEESEVDSGTRYGHYKQSKLLAESEVLKLVKENSLPAIIVNPTAPVGPGDIKPTPTGRLIRDAAFGKIPAFVNTGLNIVHVDDVAEGHYLALQRGRIGERYILGGENMSLKKILETVAMLSGRNPPKVRLSPDWVLPLAYLAETWARFTHGNEPILTVAGVKLSRQLMYFSSDKASTELGYRYRPALDAVRDAINWFGALSHTDKIASFSATQ